MGWSEDQARFEFKRDPSNGMLLGPDDCHYNTEAEAMYFGAFGLCGCGKPEAVHAFLLDCLRQFEGDSDSRGGMAGIEALVKLKPEVAAEFIGHFLDKVHLTEHGGSVYGSWLTERGRQVLEIGAHSDQDA